MTSWKDPLECCFLLIKCNKEMQTKVGREVLCCSRWSTGQLLLNFSDIKNIMFDLSISLTILSLFSLDFCGHIHLSGINALSKQIQPFCQGYLSYKYRRPDSSDHFMIFCVLCLSNNVWFPLFWSTCCPQHENSVLVSSWCFPLLLKVAPHILNR